MDTVARTGQDEARIAELIALQRIGRELNSTLDMDQILNLLIHDVVSVTPATCGSVLLLDSREHVFHPRAWCGCTREQIAVVQQANGQDHHGGLVQRVFATGRAAVVRDLRDDPDHVEIDPSVRAKLVAPIRCGPQVVGVIDLSSPVVDAFGLDHQRFVLAIAEQAAVAIGNAQRYAEYVVREEVARRRSAQLRDLIQISHGLHAEHALHDVLDQVVQAIPSTGGFGIAVLSLIEGDPPVVRRVAGAGIPLADLEALQAIEQPLAAFDRVWQERYRISRSYFLSHQEQDDSLSNVHTYTLLKQNGRWRKGTWHPDDVLIIPLRSSKGQVLGWLSLDDPLDGQVPTSESVEIVELFANEAASAIENARLYDELEMRVQERTEELAAALHHQALEVGKTRAIVESISDAVLVFDADGRVILANPATVRVLGLEPGLLLHHDVDGSDLQGLSQDQDEMARALFDAARSACGSLTGGQDWMTTIFQAARRVIQVSFSPVNQEGNDPLTMVAVLRDITAEAELEQLKSEFVSMVVHELRTPMSSIAGYVDLLLLGMLGPVNEKQSEFLGVVKDNADRLMTLVNDLSDISRIEGGGLSLRLEPLVLTDVVGQVVLAMEQQLQAKRQRLVLDVATDLPPVLADRNRLIQVVTNLLSNAHKYSPAGSAIEIGAASADGRVELVVRDQGIGISAQDQKRIFDRFFRADNALATQEDGTGLGLAISQEIVKRHGGAIEVSSVPGQGSTFRVLLQVAVQDGTA